MKKSLAKWAVTGALVLAAPLALAQTTVDYSASSTTGSSTPGSPNTGAGGDLAQNVLVLAVAGAAALGAGAYLARRRFV